MEGSGRTPSRIVITGGAGHIGSHLCDLLVARGDHVVCVDSFSSGRVDNLKAVRDEPRFELHRADATQGLTMVSGPVDAVVHLASPASPIDYLAHPLETLAAASRGTEHALELCAESGARFVLASTSEVYGDPLEHPQRESYWGHVNPIGLRSVYDEAKRFAEALTTAWRRVHGVETGIVRIFNTYGPRMRPDDGRLVSNLVVQALEGRPLTVYGDGTQTRSLCFVTDTVGGLVRFLDSGLPGPMNLGSPDEHRVLDVAHLVREVTGSGSEIVFAPLPEDDPTRRCPDIDRARRHLGWTPTVALRDGLEQTARWFREKLGGRSEDPKRSTNV